MHKELKLVESTSKQLKESRDMRDKAVTKAREQGFSLGQLAKASGLTRSGVQGILRRTGMEEK